MSPAAKQIQEPQNPEPLRDPQTPVSHPEARLAFLINEGMKRKGITIQKLSEVSGVAMKYLEHMSGGNIEKFPPAPYLRNYLIVIGRVLNFDGQTVWDNIRVDELAVGSGKNDRLPRDLSVLTSRKSLVWIVGIGALFALYLLFRLPEIIGKPSLDIGFPTEAVSTVNISPVTILGTVKNGDEFFVNGERVPLGADGLWQKNIELQEGMNTIELRAKKFLGQEMSIVRQIIYTPSAASFGSRVSSTTATSTNSNTTSSSSITASTSLNP
ncbi:MAG: helix-turn-helix domain-containing protein [Patescibacteria group bacterium]